MPTDKWGHPHIHPSKVGGFSWQLPSNPNNDQFIRTGVNVINNGDGSYSFDQTDSVRFDLCRDVNWDRIGCDMDQAAAERRGYGNKESTDFRDVEWKFLLKVDDGTAGKRMGIRVVTGRHSGEPCNEGSDYGGGFDYMSNPLRWRFAKEQYHSEYAMKEFFTRPDILNDAVLDLGRFVGFGFCRYNVVNDQGFVSVVLEMYVNPNPAADKFNWREFGRIEDKGGWGSKGLVAKARTADQILSWAMPIGFSIKLDDPDVDFKFKEMSFREIAPFTSSAPEDPAPVTQFGFSELQIRRHINTERFSACTTGFAGTVGLYSQLVQNGNTDLVGTGYSAGEQLDTLSSVLFNHIVTEGSVFVKKTGTPVGNLLLTIRKASNAYATIERTLASITPASVGTSETEIVFTDAGNTYRMQLDDRIGLEHNGTSSNYYEVYRDDDSSYDGANSRRYTCKPDVDGCTFGSGDLKAVFKGIL